MRDGLQKPTLGKLETVTCTAVLRPFFLEIGAGEGIRTLDPNLGKVVLYH